MRLIYRGDQAKIISELSTVLGDSPTELVYKLAKNLHEIVIKTPIDAHDAQEKDNDREEDKR